MDIGREKRFRQLGLVIVDEDHGYGNIPIQWLRSLGVNNVVRDASPTDARRIVGERQIDVIITEWYPQFVAFLRDPEKNPQLHSPIRVVTGQVHAKEIFAARDAGVDDVMAKPVSAGVLTSHIHDIVVDRHPFTENPTFFGPHRRRRKSNDFDGPERRLDGEQAD